MRLALPLVRPHAREHTYCAYCPKLCRHTCPVSVAEASETTSPWGKMTSLHHVDVGNLPAHASYASTWYACTGCMACREHCAHGNEVAMALSAGRAEALARGLAPEAAGRVVAEHGPRMERFRKNAEALFGSAATRSADTVYVPGCTAVGTGDDVATQEWQAVRTLLGDAVRVETEACCGLPLLEAGDQAGFLEAARHFAARTRSAARVLFGDAGCMHALTRIAPSLGVEGPKRALHVTELFDEHRERLRPLPRTAGDALAADDAKVRYHDACRLGRGLGIYDPPRAVLAAVLGRAPAEYFHRREAGLCSGAGGQLPRTRPETAGGVTRLNLDEHESLGGGVIVTACVSARRRFQKEGADARSLSTLVHASLLGAGR